MSKTTGSCSKAERFGSKRAYRRWLKRQGGGGASASAAPDTRHELETLEQRLLLSASPVFELSDLLGSNGGNGSEGVIINGVSLGDRAGISVGSAGDINGDGFEDVIIGAFRDSPNGAESGASFVVFGQAGGFNSTMQLSSLNGLNGFKINGVAAGDLSGRSVAGAGDVNNDGFDDLLIGSFMASPNGAESGQAYVVYGHSGSFGATLELSALNGSNGFTINGLTAGDRLGFSVRGGGDVNGDGIDDFILGASLDEPNGTASGSAYVVFGQNGGFGSSLDLASLNGGNGFAIAGVSADDQLGISVNTAGDVNGDGLDDLVVGAFLDDPNGVDSGAAYVVFGRTSGFSSSLNPSTLNGSNGFAINGGAAADNAGRSVSSAGDFNGDGFFDILIGAPLATGSAADSGNAYVVFGKGTSFASSINLASLNGTNGFRLNGIDTDDQAGLTVATAGDVNGDGLDDLLISGDRANPNGTRSGETYLVLGRSTTPATLNLSALTGADGFVLNGINAQDRAGFAVRSAGDVDGDGFGDLIIGAFLADPNGGESGESYLVFGGDFSDAVTHLGSAGQDGLAGTGGADVIVAGAGDDVVTGNGGADVLLGGQGDDEFVINGTGFSRIDGGSGADLLTLTGTGITLDLTAISDSRLRHIEAIDISAGTNTLTLNQREVLNLSGTSNTLRVTLNINSTLNRGSGWTQTGSQTVNGNLEVTYSQGQATLIVTTLADIIDPVVTVDALTTDVRSPELTGTVTDLDPTVTVDVTVNGTTYGATVNGDGTWTLPAGTIGPDLVDGVYEVVAVGTDSSGNIGNDQTFGELLIDNVAPVVTVDTVNSADLSPELTGTVVDADPLTTITVTVSGSDYVAVNNGDGTWTLPSTTIVPDLAEGVYEVSVLATDTPGRSGNDSTTDELTIDTTDPVVTLDDPGTQNTATPELTGTIDDVDAGAQIKVAITDGVDTIEVDAVNNGNGTWTLPPENITPELIEGTYAITVQATDAAGNSGIIVEPKDLVIDLPPVVTVDLLTTSDQRPQITGTIVDNNTTADVTVTVNGAQYTATNNGDGTWTLADDAIVVSLAEGVYDVSATVVDTGGNVGNDTGTDELTIDTTAPTVGVNDLITSDARPELTGTVSDDESTIEVTVNSVTYTAVNNGDGTWTLPDNTISFGQKLTDGVYDVAVTATNLSDAGNAGNDPGTDELTVDTQAPVLGFDSLVSFTGSPELTGTVTDILDPDATIIVTIVGQGARAAINNGDGTWTLPANTISPPLSHGVYDVTVQGVDAAGNLGETVTTDTLEIIDEVAPVVTINPKATSDTTPLLTGSVFDIFATVVVTVNGVDYAAVNNHNTTWVLPDNRIAVALADGIYDVSVTATDSAGNVGTDSTTDELRIDTIDPLVTLDSLQTFNQTPTLTGTVVDADLATTISVTVTGIGTFSAVNNGDGTWTLPGTSFTTPIPIGTYEVVVTALDSALNIKMQTVAAGLEIQPSPFTVGIDTLSTGDTTPQLTGTVSDPAATIVVTVEGTDYAAVNNGNGTWTLADDAITPALVDGTYNIVATGTLGGDVVSDSTVDELVVDTLDPAVTVDALVTGDTTPTITGTINDTTAAISVLIDGNTYGAVNNGNGTWTLADDTIAPALADGVYEVAVTATDNAGNIGEDSSTNELRVDTTDPVVTLDTLLTQSQTPTLTGTVVDVDTEATIKVTITGIGLFDAVNHGDGTWTLPGSVFTTPIPFGIYDVIVTALDSVLNVTVETVVAGLEVTDASFTITVNPLTTIDSTPQLTGTVSDPSVSIVVTVNGLDYAAVNNGNGTWTLADDTITPALVSGTYNVTATGTLGVEVVADTTTNELTVDTIVPVVTIDHLTTSDTRPALAGTIDDATAVISVLVNGTAYVGVNNGDGTWSLPDNTISPALPVGTYDIRITAVDGVGNFGTDGTLDELLITNPTVSSIDLADLLSANGGDGSEGVVFNGVAAGDLSGVSASSAGDINGDGYDDLIIGANGTDPVSNNDGTAYVIFGQAGGFGAEFDLSTLNGTNGFRMDGLSGADDLGVSVASAGDLNGDGLDDLVIGASKADANGNFNAGAAYIVFGQTAPFAATLDLSTLNGSNGFRFDGENIVDRAGFSVSSAGDVNGDGLDDVMVGTISGDDGVTIDSGRTYIIFGTTSVMPAVMTEGDLTGANGFIITGPDAGGGAGFSVGSAGDMNGDGFADLRIGAPGSEVGGNINAGKTFVVFGKSGGLAAELNMSTLNGTNGFVIEGDTADMDLGFSGGSLGDFNGDGYDDLLVSAPASSDVNSAGTAYVIYGHAGAYPAALPLSLLNGTVGFTILGQVNEDQAGFNVSGVGDVNGDGFDDMLIGAPVAAGGTFENGESYLVFGRASGIGATLDLSTVPGNGGIVFNGAGVLDNSGRYVSGAGDVNGDGYDDLLIAVRNADISGIGNDAGQTYLIYGRDFTGTVTQAGGTSGEVLTGTSGRDAIIAGGGDDDLIGNGGPDILSAGQGDDTLAVSDTAFTRVDGGSGFDTLRLDGAGVSLDLSAIGDPAVSGIEQIDIRGTGANSLTVNLLEVLNLSDTTNTLLVLSDTDDTVDIGAGWTAAGQEVIGSDTFDVFTQGNATVKLLVPGDTVDPVVTVDALTTTDTTPQLTGTVVDDDPATTIQVTVNGTAYSATNNGDGTWTLADNTITPALGLDTYNVSVVATDSSSNTGSDATTNELIVEAAPVTGDLDGDGFVGITDLSVVLSNWNATVTPGSQPDPTGDGFVGIEDLNVVLGNWNAGTPPVAETADSSVEQESTTGTEQVQEATQASEPEVTATLGKVSLVDEVSPVTSEASQGASTNAHDTTGAAAWGWMVDGSRSSRTAFVGDAEDDEAGDSALGLAEPMADQSGVSRL